MRLILYYYYIGEVTIMRRTFPILVSIALAFCLVEVGEATDIGSDYRAPTDTKEHGGEIVSPQICPVDTAWISYEVHNKSEVRLFIQNIVTGERIQVTSKLDNDELDDFGFESTPQDRYLDWRPLRDKAGDIWVAFSGNATGSGQLYLFNLSDRKTYLMDYSLVKGDVVRDPAWSPDGKIIAYSSQAGGASQIFMLRQMDRILKDPENEKWKTAHERVVAGKNVDQFAPVWHPTTGVGVFAYNEFQSSAGKLKIKTYDLKLLRSFDVVNSDPTLNYFGPNWSPDGERLGYYQYTGGASDPRKGLVSGEKYFLGLAEVRYTSDSLIVNALKGGLTRSPNVVEIARNSDLYLGPAWTPNSKSILISLRKEDSDNPLNTIDVQPWINRLSKKQWLTRLDTNPFKFPTDISITGSKVTMTFSQGQKRALLYGSLTGLPAPNPAPPAALAIAAARKSWWKEYGDGKNPRGGGFLKFLTSPLIGPNIALNTPAFLLLGGGGYAVKKILEDDPPPPPAPGWTPPRYPNPIKALGPVLSVGLKF